MSLMIATLLFNAVMFCLLGLVIFWFRQHPAWRRLLAGGLALLVLSFFVSVVLCLPNRDLLRAARLVCFGWFGHVSLFLASAVLLGGNKSIRTLSGCILAAVLAVAFYGFRIEPFHLEVTHYFVTTPKVSRPLKLGLLADFQTDQFHDYQRSALRRLMQEQPDAIFLAGDYLQARSQEDWQLLRDKMNAHLKDISFGAPLGVFAVGGNTDYQRWPEIFDGLETVNFRASTTIETDQLRVTGLSVADSFSTRAAVASSPSSKFSIVLGHAPDFAMSAGIQADLLLAGHTHGGQVRIPMFGPLITFSRVPRSWAAGKTQINDSTTLIVSRGVGMERRDAPRIRLFCRPELAFIHVVPAE